MTEHQYRNIPYDSIMEFASIEKIPAYYYKSNLQRAVQFIKRHRDIYYDRSNIVDDKPSSILIPALVADNVKHKVHSSIEEIISIFIESFTSKSISIMQDDKILNLVYLRENLIEKYSIDKVNKMYRWLGELKKL